MLTIRMDSSVLAIILSSLGIFPKISNFLNFWHKAQERLQFAKIKFYFYCLMALKHETS